MENAPIKDARRLGVCPEWLSHMHLAIEMGRGEANLANIIDHAISIDLAGYMWQNRADSRTNGVIKTERG